jgi:hypothetical protein
MGRQMRIVGGHCDPRSRQRFWGVAGGAVIVLWTSASTNDALPDPPVTLAAYASGSAPSADEASAAAALKLFRQYAFHPVATETRASPEREDSGCGNRAVAAAAVSPLRLSRRHMEFALPLGSRQLRRIAGYRLRVQTDHVEKLQMLAALRRYAKVGGVACTKLMAANATAVAVLAADHAAARRLASKSVSGGPAPIASASRIQRLFSFMSVAKAPGVLDLDEIAGRIAKAAALR